jgi:transcriptional regulator with XRE-family HTH domain
MRITLSSALEGRGWSPDQLAEKAGVHRATVYRIASGEIRNPSSLTVEALEVALELPRGSLRFGVPPDAERHEDSGAAGLVQSAGDVVCAVAHADECAGRADQRPRDSRREGSAK